MPWCNKRIITNSNSSPRAQHGKPGSNRPPIHLWQRRTQRNMVNKPRTMVLPKVQQLPTMVPLKVNKLPATAQPKGQQLRTMAPKKDSKQNDLAPPRVLKPAAVPVDFLAGQEMAPVQ